MPPTKIDYCDRSINPIKGLCPMGCDYCYARRIYQRFHLDPAIRFDMDALDELHKVKKPSRFFIGSTFELFGPWVSDVELDYILMCARRAPQHTCIFLTKYPQRLVQFNPWPPNAWVGTTVTNQRDAEDRLWRLRQVETRVRFISFEPLLGPIEAGTLRLQGIGWIIIGAMTGPGAIKPQADWIDTIGQAAGIAKIPLFLKHNLHWHETIQEYPNAI